MASHKHASCLRLWMVLTEIWFVDEFVIRKKWPANVKIMTISALCDSLQTCRRCRIGGVSGNLRVCACFVTVIWCFARYLSGYSKDCWNGFRNMMSRYEIDLMRPKWYIADWSEMETLKLSAKTVALVSTMTTKPSHNAPRDLQKHLLPKSIEKLSQRGVVWLRFGNKSIGRAIIKS